MSYLDVFNSSQVYELVKKLFQLHKDAEYYNELNFMFIELDHRRRHDMTYAADNEKQRKHIVED